MSSYIPEVTSSVCVACRIRRRKCDRKQPMCSGCEELQIPAENCVFRKKGLRLKMKSTKETLENERRTHQELLTEQAQLQEALGSSPGPQHAHQVPQKAAQPDLNAPHQALNALHQALNAPHQALTAPQQPTKQPQQATKQPQQSSRHSLIFKAVRENSSNLLHVGPLSWAALLITEKGLVEVWDSILAVLKHASSTYAGSKLNSLRGQIAQDTNLQRIKDLVSEVTLGIQPIHSYAFMDQLVREIQSNLPAYQTVMQLLAAYFEFNRATNLQFIEIDADSFYSSLGDFLRCAPDGSSQLSIKIPTEAYKLVLLARLLSILSHVYFNQMELYNTDICNLNYLLMVEYSDTVLLASTMYSKVGSPGTCVDSYLTLECLQTLIHLYVFDTCMPYRRNLVGMEVSYNYMTIRRIVSLAKYLRLHENIDEIYASYSVGIRRSMKSAWYYLAMCDCDGSLEVGLPTKISSGELQLKYRDFDNNFTQAVVTLNKVIESFDSISSKTHTADFVDFIENTLIKDLKTLLNVHFATLKGDLDYFKTFNLDDTSLVYSVQRIMETFSIRFTIYSLIELLYNHCLKKLQQDGDYNGNLKRFDMLTNKYVLLIFQMICEVLVGFQRIAYHDNSKLFSPFPFLVRCFWYARLAARRAMIYLAGAYVMADGIDKKKLFTTFFHNKPITPIHILVQEVIQAKPEYAVEFDCGDLEDFEIDKRQNYAQFSEKFHIFNDKDYEVIAFSRFMATIKRSLVNPKYNFNFVINHSVFFHIAKFNDVNIQELYSRVVAGPGSAAGGGESAAAEPAVANGGSNGAAPGGVPAPGGHTDNALGGGPGGGPGGDRPSSAAPHNGSSTTNSSTPTPTASAIRSNSPQQRTQDEFNFMDFFETAIDTRSNKFNYDNFFSTSGYGKWDDEDVDIMLDHLRNINPRYGNSSNMDYFDTVENRNPNN